MRTWDRLSAVLLLLAALVVWREASRVPAGGLSHPGPGFLPLVAAGLLGLLSAGLFVEASLRRREAAAALLAPAPAWRKIGAMMAGLVVYALVLEKVGYLLSTAPLLALFMILERQRWVTVVAMALAATLASYWLFAVWLQVPLPKGVFPR